MYGDRMDYGGTLTPVSERTTRDTACGLAHQVLLGTEADMIDIVTAIEKVRTFAEELRDWEDPEEPEVITRG